MVKPSRPRKLKAASSRGRRLKLPGGGAFVGPISPPPERGVFVGPISPPPENFGQLLITQAARMIGRKR
jgi:hypothetical protein